MLRGIVFWKVCFSGLFRAAHVTKCDGTVAVGNSVDDYYNNALSESINGLYQAVVIHEDCPGVGLRSRASNIDLDGVVQQSPTTEFNR
tara:strand:+ start:463 stop:726 length:264 start_codon:yes stop_codon:yes gene_type:complete